MTAAAVFGRDTLVNPTFGSVYVLLWIGLVPASLLFGRIYRLCNPLRWLNCGICRLAWLDRVAYTLTGLFLLFSS